MHLTYSDQLILSSVRIHPTAADLETLDALIPLINDWDYLSRTIIERGIGPLFFQKLSLLSNAALIPEVATSNLQQAYFRTLSRSMVLYDTFRKAAEAFNRNGIEVVALKGIHLAEWLYGDIGLRQCSDIDLLVRKEEGEKCLQILTGLGFKQSGDEVSHLITEKIGIVHYPAMLLGDVSVELHIRLHNTRKAYRLDVNQIIGNAVPITLNHTPVKGMELHDLLLFLCVHLDKHFMSGEVQFTGFADITNLLDMHAAEIDWQKLESSCISYNCVENVYKYLMIAARYFHAPVPEEVTGKYAGSLHAADEELFHRYLNGFRPKAYGTSTHLKNITEIKNVGEKLRYLLKVIFPSRKFMAGSYAMKHPSLFWLYYPTRHWKGLKELWKMIAPSPQTPPRFQTRGKMVQRFERNKIFNC